jgi:hypothetical protein
VRFRIAYISFLFLSVAFITKAQDVIYTTSAVKIECKVTELNEISAVYKKGEIIDSIGLRDVYLIHYANGRIERYGNIPEELSNTKEAITVAEKSQQVAVLINGLALMNSDATLMLEYRLKNPRYSLGGFGAYNFNARASLLNIFVAPLPNSKKHFDVGLYFFGKLGNYNRSRITPQLGVITKYMSFSYDQVLSNNTTRKTRDYQYAVIPYSGIDIQLSKVVFLRGFAGIGGFSSSQKALKAHERIGNELSPYAVESSVFFKLYLGICAGWEF